MKRTEAIKKFLELKKSPLSHLYNEDMEVQVNVSRGKGEPYNTTYEGRRIHGFTDGLTKWKSFRIPWAANTEPEYDKENQIRFDISKHVEAIGMTGWDWYNKKSIWVGFDFDSIIGHKEGLTGDEIQNIEHKIKQIPWATIYTSTSGLGLHIYVFIDNSPIVETHTEHAAIARAILSKMSAETGIKLEAKVDSLGGILWCWHIKQQSNGFNLVKKGNSLETIPSNWKDYLSIVSNKSLVEKPITDQDILAASQIQHDLDKEHLELLKYLENTGAYAWWDSAKFMLVCHTFDLKCAHESLKFKGIFETISKGSDHGNDQNCFCFPLSDGGWTIRRHTRGTTEHNTWFSDKSGYTTCYFNKLPSLRTASKIVGGTEGEKEYYFKTLNEAVLCLSQMGLECEAPINLGNRPATIKQNEARIVLRFIRDDNDPQLPDWISKQKPKQWERVFFQDKIADTIELPDNTVRFLTADGSDLGWFVNTNKSWITTNRSNVSSVLLASGYAKTQIEVIFGKCIHNNWSQVIRPFKPEYPGNREWNRNSPQFRFNPEQGKHPSWDAIITHIGSQLEVKENKWCMDYGITTGSLYLMTWISALFQEPDQPLPYLVLIGQQNTGKSILHESLSLLVTHGVVRADGALTNQSGFNGELVNSFLCVVEETNLNKSGYASDRIKDWVTGRTISIRAMYQSPIDVPNHTHWIQCTNDPTYCPIFPGDTRIVVLEVPTLPESGEIPKSILLERLENESPAFINSIFNFDIPDCIGRLRIPVIETSAKAKQQELNKSSLAIFLEEKMHQINGASELLSEVSTAFRDYIGTESVNWSNIAIGKELTKLGIEKGRAGGSGQMTIGNYSFSSEVESGSELKVNGKGRLE